MDKASRERAIHLLKQIGLNLQGRKITIKVLKVAAVKLGVNPLRIKNIKGGLSILRAAWEEQLTKRSAAGSGETKASSTSAIPAFQPQNRIIPSIPPLPPAPFQPAFSLRDIQHTVATETTANRLKDIHLVDLFADAGVLTQEEAEQARTRAKERQESGRFQKTVVGQRAPAIPQRPPEPILTAPMTNPIIPPTIPPIVGGPPVRLEPDSENEEEFFDSISGLEEQHAVPFNFPHSAAVDTDHASSMTSTAISDTDSVFTHHTPNDLNPIEEVHAPAPEGADLRTMTVVQLRTVLKDAGQTGYSRLNKIQLINRIQEGLEPIVEES